jgi:membrane-bound lytic murein transglycosylase D
MSTAAPRLLPSLVSRVAGGVLVVMVAWAALVAAPAQAVPPEFEKPSALVPNVAFWKRVYGEWRLDDIALHDEEDLGVVYRVVRVPKRGQKDDKGRTRQQAITDARLEVEAAMRALAKKQPKDETGLTGLEKDVFVALKASTRPDKYTRTAKIRGQNGLYERFVQGYSNSGLYERFITEELAKNGLPKELIGIAFVESLFAVQAKSHVGAAGVWQFMSYTGKEYMQLNPVVDERWDPILATEAAAKYLKQAKKELSTWPLAVTSYNYGRGGMKGLARSAGTNDFNVILAVTKGKRFGFAARNYYASFLAVLEILDEASVRFAGVQKKPAWSYDVIRTPFPVFSTQLVGTNLVDQATFEWLNPALSTDAARGRLPLPHGMSVRVPKGQGDAIVTALLALPARDKQKAMRVAKAVHTAPTKQKLADVAKKHGVPVELVAARNGIAKDHVLAKGDRVVIPPPQPKTSLLPEARAMPLPAMIEAPVLLADAAELLPEAVPAPPKKHGLNAEPLLTASALKGTVQLVRVKSAPLSTEPLPGVDAVAGLGVALPAIDVMAGDPGANTRVVPVVADVGADEDPGQS